MKRRRPRTKSRSDLNAHIRTCLKEFLKQAAHLGPGSDGQRSVKAVHRMRVLSRRLDALIALNPEMVGRRRLKKGLKRLHKLRKGLGRIRNWDVLRKQWKEYARTLPCFGVIDREIGKKRDRAFERFEQEFPARAVHKSVQRVQKAVSEQRAVSIKGGTGPFRSHLRALFENVLEDRDLHQVRLDLKKLRYALEGLEAMKGRHDGVGLLKELQSELGRLNDQRMLDTFLSKLRKKRADRWGPALAAAVEKVADDLRDRMLIERHRWDRVWPQRRRKLRELGDMPRTL